MAIGLLFFAAIGLLEYRILDGKFKKLSDYRITDLGLNLSDYQISDSEKSIGCPLLVIIPLLQQPRSCKEKESYLSTHSNAKWLKYDKLLFTLCIITNWITRLLWILISPSHLLITWITMTSCILYTNCTMPALLTLTYIILFLLHYPFVHFLFSICNPNHAPHIYSTVFVILWSYICICRLTWGQQYCPFMEFRQPYHFSYSCVQ